MEVFGSRKFDFEFIAWSDTLVNRLKLKLTILTILIISIKMYLSLRFPTPFAFGDEYLYSSYAKDILLDPFSIVMPVYKQIYPPGYSLLLIPNFILFYPDMEMVYRSILATNAILSTLVFMISYLILKSFISKTSAIYGSVLITLLPINILYNFMILSENIYIPLYLLSGYMILKSFEKDIKLLHFFTGLVIFYLTITRAFGILAYVSFFVIVLYKIFIEKHQRVYFLKKNCVLICTPIILLCVWSLLKKIYSLDLYEYDSGEYLQSVSYIFSDPQNLILFLKLIINEMDYLMLASYFIFFILSILTFLYWYRLDQPIKIYILYSFVYAILSIILTALNNIGHFRNPSDSLYVYYFMYGRYVDPILPTIFIIGLISWDKFVLYRNKDFDYDNIIKKLAFIGMSTVLIFMVTYPYHALYSIMNDRAVNIISIYYTKYIGILIYMLPIIFLVLYFMLSKRPKILIAMLITFSLLTSIPAYEWIKMGSNSAESINNIGKFLQTMKDESILIDQEISNDYYSRNHLLIRFWAMPNNLIYGHIDINNITSDIGYIVSRKPIPYRLLLISSGQIMLYRSDIANSIQTIPTDGFYNLKYDSNYPNYISDTWIENNATLHIYVPFENLTIRSLIFETKSFYNPRNLQIYINDELISKQQIPKDFVEIQTDLKLKYGDNIVKFYTPDECQRPIDVINSGDKRCLSFYFKYITLID